MRNPFDLITPTNIVSLIGVVVIGAGIYFELNSMTSSGVTMGRYGRPYGKGTIDGKGMIFCGIIIFGAGFVMKDKKEKKDDENQ